MEEDEEKLSLNQTNVDELISPLKYSELRASMSHGWFAVDHCSGVDIQGE